MKDIKVEVRIKCVAHLRLLENFSGFICRCSYLEVWLLGIPTKFVVSLPGYNSVLSAFPFRNLTALTWHDGFLLLEFRGNFYSPAASHLGKNPACTVRKNDSGVTSKVDSRAGSLYNLGLTSRQRVR